MFKLVVGLLGVGILLVAAIVPRAATAREELATQQLFAAALQTDGVSIEKQKQLLESLDKAKLRSDFLDGMASRLSANQNQVRLAFNQAAVATSAHMSGQGGSTEARLTSFIHQLAGQLHVSEAKLTSVLSGTLRSLLVDRLADAVKSGKLNKSGQDWMIAKFDEKAQRVQNLIKG